MAEVFFIADLHFSHRGIVRFADPESGVSLRPWDTTESMDQDLVERWNRVVGARDKVFVLGDFVINRRALPVAAQLAGLKTLVCGNHDTFRTEEYARYFKDQKGAVDYKGWILTHVPVHPSQLSRWSANVHGHLHARKVGDPRYLCVSAEQTDYAPITYEEVARRLRQQAEE